MRGMKLEHIEPRPFGHFSGRHELVAHQIHIGAIHFLRHLVARDQGTAEADMIGQLPSGSGASISSQPSWVEPLRPECPIWQQIFASVSACTKSTIRFQAASCSAA